MVVGSVTSSAKDEVAGLQLRQRGVGPSQIRSRLVLCSWTPAAAYAAWVSPGQSGPGQHGLAPARRGLPPKAR